MYKMEFYSAVKQKEIIEFTDKRMEMETMAVDGLTQAKATNSSCSFYFVEQSFEFLHLCV